ncbi:MAG TPA: hypothetical protein DCO79_12820 [Spirochaeta sp.]|nr:hypothetical protein [Spirochaeta sp.]
MLSSLAVATALPHYGCCQYTAEMQQLYPAYIILVPQTIATQLPMHDRLAKNFRRFRNSFYRYAVRLLQDQTFSAGFSSGH